MTVLKLGRVSRVRLGRGSDAAARTAVILRECTRYSMIILVVLHKVTQGPVLYET